MIQTLLQISTFLTIAILLGVTIGYLFALAQCSEKNEDKSEILNENLHVDELTGIVSDASQLNKAK
jgi:energy-converting hydrogenase Eha subunit G